MRRSCSRSGRPHVCRRCCSCSSSTVSPPTPAWRRRRAPASARPKVLAVWLARLLTRPVRTGSSVSRAADVPCQPIPAPVAGSRRPTGEFAGIDQGLRAPNAAVPDVARSMASRVDPPRTGPPRAALGGHTVVVSRSSASTLRPDRDRRRPPPEARRRLTPAQIDRYEEEGSWQRLSLRSFLSETAARDPRAIAAVGYIGGALRSSVITYAELDDLSRALAAGLRSLGAGPGDVVAVMSRNRVEFGALIFAINEIGAGLHWDSRRRTARARCGRCSPERGGHGGGRGGGAGLDRPRPQVQPAGARRLWSSCPRSRTGALSGEVSLRRPAARERARRRRRRSCCGLHIGFTSERPAPRRAR